jgi:hypothetical protein
MKSTIVFKQHSSNMWQDIASQLVALRGAAISAVSDEAEQKNISSAIEQILEWINPLDASSRADNNSALQCKEVISVVLNNLANLEDALGNMPEELKSYLNTELESIRSSLLSFQDTLPKFIDSSDVIKSILSKYQSSSDLVSKEKHSTEKSSMSLKKSAGKKSVEKETPEQQLSKKKSSLLKKSLLLTTKQVMEESKHEESKHEESKHEEATKLSASEAKIAPVMKMEKILTPKEQVVQHEERLDALLIDAMGLAGDIVATLKNNHYKLRASKYLSQFSGILSSFQQICVLASDLIKITKHQDEGMKNFQQLQFTLMSVAGIMHKLKQDENLQEIMAPFRKELEKLEEMRIILSNYYKADDNPDSLYQMAAQMRNDGFAHKAFEFIAKHEWMLKKNDIDLNLSDLKKFLPDGKKFVAYQDNNYINELGQYKIKVENAINKLWEFKLFNSLSDNDVKAVDILACLAEMPKFPLSVALNRCLYELNGNNQVIKYSVLESVFKRLGDCLHSHDVPILHGYDDLAGAINTIVQTANLLQADLKKFELHAVDGYFLMANYLESLQVQDRSASASAAAIQEQEADEVQDDSDEVTPQQLSGEHQEVIGESHHESCDI